MVTALARHYGFDIDTPFEELPERVREVVLYGSEGEPIEFLHLDGRGNRVSRVHPFEGIARSAATASVSWNPACFRLTVNRAPVPNAADSGPSEKRRMKAAPAQRSAPAVRAAA